MMNICTFLCFMACAFVLAACSDSDEDVIVQGGLTGNWYSTCLLYTSDAADEL